ncbi:Uncharacterized protein BM_BM17588 [Brugia malayi]|uniref:Uncharacterized protein n=1 Tax=Brugia malayi TaxID=6279 RepID=A0A4E9FRB9_BRUMA|nr:Uncharacterized protein BM_BM17588 [Brugia malayi]VIO95123.1 Uncharacterized protein BM_BM17588 [Brugia malayi]
MLWVDEFVIIWDAFAVLAPIGPLRRISGKAHEYSDQEAKSKHIQQRKALGHKTSVRLGMGDFIFYSLLVDKTSATRSMCVADSMAGWLAYSPWQYCLATMNPLQHCLFRSITIAVLLHSGIYLFVEPFHNRIVMSTKLFTSRQNRTISTI